MLEVYDALKLAIEKLQEQGLMYRDEYKLTASRVEGDWVFWFLFLPEIEGMDVTAAVDGEGNVRTLVGF